jgi:cytochrome c553
MRTPKSCAVLVVAVASTVATPTSAVDWRAPRVVAVSCSACHGVDGNTDSPIAPRLAAQSAGYLTAQMNAYRLARAPSPVDAIPFLSRAEKPGARTNGEARRLMIGPAQSIDEADLKAAVDWYAQQKPAPGTPAGNAGLVARGAKIYAEGFPDDGVSACAGCHGPKGDGRGDTFPRLAGQHADYLFRQLKFFADGQRTATVSATTHTLVTTDMEAVAEYLQQL